MIRIFTITALTLTLITFSSPGHALTIGRWCDRMLPSTPEYNRIITIHLNSEGSLEAHSTFGDGSKMTQRLQEISGSVFSVADSSHGDRYRIVPTSGELQLIDNDGLIRVAGRLENMPNAGECGF